VVTVVSGTGCAARWDRVDAAAVDLARLGLAQEGVREGRRRFSLPNDEEDYGPPAKEGPGIGSVILGEMLAIFPGLLVHGLGHYYAGDYRTATRLRHVGEFGYIMTAIGGGLGVGGYFLEREDLTGTAYGLYATGAVVGAAGLFYIMTAWFYDMIDTPRAVRSRGRPPVSSGFVESLDIFD
jgi:hypothetical protein